ncbi:carbon-nitrogen hydrolase [Xylaria nigripes]|nr:carbon-nitrogen hydrolase [Xylaria nigripes]
MRIGCLQFAPQVGDVDNNLNRADAILNKANPEDLDLLVLPELAFSGYNFKSLRDISPYLEPTGAGITSVWARTTALKHNCKVVVGYPESADVSERWPTSLEYYNSAIMVNEDGDTCGHYRKSHLYYTDESWAFEGSGFFSGTINGIGKVAMGICMDINPYKFEAPWNAYEFAFHVLDVVANVVILSMAWLTREDAAVFSCHPREPDMETLTYWVTRLEPLIRAETDEEIIVIFANRTGSEDEAVYAGTSAVLGIQNGEVTVYGMLGRGDKDLLVVDTKKPGYAKLVYRPEPDTQQATDASGNEADTQPDRDDNSEGPGSSGSLSASSGPPSHTEDQPDDTALSCSILRSSSGNVFIDSAAIQLSNTRVQNSKDAEPPILPRYFWNQSQPKYPMAGQNPNFGVQYSYEEWHPSFQPDRRLIDRRMAMKDLEAPSSNSKDAVDGLGNNRTTGYLPLDQQTSAEISNVYTFKQEAAKSGDRIDESNIGLISSSRKQRLRRSSTDPQCSPEHAHESIVNANANRDVKRKTFRRRTSTPRKESHTPDLEKLGADLMIFEGERASRPKRDSLICHVDEDDYIVLRRDTVPQREPDERVSRSASSKPQQTLYRTSSQKSQAKDANGLRSVAPKQVSRPDSHSYDASMAEPLLMGNSRQRKHESAHPSASYDVLLRQDTSPPKTRALPSDKHPDDKRAVKEGRVDRHAVLPIQKGRSNESSKQSFAVGSMPSADNPIRFSINASDTASSPRKLPSETVSVPRTGLVAMGNMWKNMPPTPKAMVIPHEYYDDAGHRNDPHPPKNQVSAIVT